MDVNFVIAVQKNVVLRFDPLKEHSSRTADGLAAPGDIAWQPELHRADTELRELQRYVGAAWESG